jgi:hypothetical protein
MTGEWTVEKQTEKTKQTKKDSKKEGKNTYCDTVVSIIDWLVFYDTHVIIIFI